MEIYLGLGIVLGLIIAYISDIDSFFGYGSIAIVVAIFWPLIFICIILGSTVMFMKWVNWRFFE